MQVYGTVRQTVRDRVAARVRTAVPLVLGHAAAAVVAYVAGRTGVELDSVLVYEALALVLAMGVYETGRWLEVRRSPLLRGAGRFLLSLGIHFGPPVYPRSGGAHRAPGSPDPVNRYPVDPER